MVFDIEDTRRFLEQFITDFVMPIPEQELTQYREAHMFAETAYNHLEGHDFFRGMQLTLRHRINRQNCRKKCLDLDENNDLAKKKYDIPVVYTEPRHYAIYPLQLPEEGQYLEDIFLANFTVPVHYDKVCRACQTRTNSDYKRQQTIEEVVRFPNAFVISLNRVFWNNNDPPQREKNPRRIQLREIMDIPQTNQTQPPISYR